MIWLILAAIVACLLWYNFVRPMSHFKKLGVECTKPWPFFGDQWRTLFRRMSFYDFVEYIYRISPKSKYFGFYQFTTPTLMIRDPELIKQLAVKDFDHFTDHRAFIDAEADPLWGGNLFSLKGQRWREMRATLSGSYTSSKMKSMFGLMNEAASNFVQFFIDKNTDLFEVEMKDTFTRYTNDVIATTAFGIKVESLKEPNNEFYLMGKKITTFSGFVIRMKLFGYLIFPTLLKFFRVPFFDRDTSNFFKSIINETIKARESKGIIRQDMINQLLEARKGIKTEDTEETDTGFATVAESDMSKFKRNKNLSNADITSQALVFFLAGFDTISTALCFCTYELVVNKDVQDQLRKEINDTYEQHDGEITYEVLLKMKFLDMVISESLRLWPPVVAMDRQCVKPYTLETPEKTIKFNVGDVIWLPAVALHRDPNYYPDPLKFDPERFNDERKDAIKPYTYIPFGTGPRNCIGSRFALLEIKALLFHLLRNFEIVRTEKTQIPVVLNKRDFNPLPEKGFWFAFKRI